MQQPPCIMDPRKMIAAIASGLSVALLTASILRDTRSLDTPPEADSFLQRRLHSATTRGTGCGEVYRDRFYDAILAMSPDVACRPQFPAEIDCADALQVKQRRKAAGTSCFNFAAECRGNNKPLCRERSRVSECDLPKGSLHCWHKLTNHWFHRDKPIPMDNCIFIYPTLPSSPSPSPSRDTFAPLPPPTLPIPPPTPFPSISTASIHAQLMTHPFIYSNGVSALTGILPHLAPLPSGSNSSYIYLTCNSSRQYPKGSMPQRLMVVNFHQPSTSEHQGAGGSSSNTSHIKVTILPGVSRAAFYRNYPLSTQTLQEMEEAQGAAILDFPMHQASGQPKGIEPFISEFLSQISNYLTSESIFGDKLPIFVSGIAPCYNHESINSDPNQDSYIEDSMSRSSINQATAIDNFLCSAVHIQHSWWNSSELIDLQKVNDHVTSLQVELSEHISKQGQFPVSVSVIHHLKQQVVPSKLVPPGNDANNGDILLASHVRQLGGSMSKSIHVILSDGGTTYHPKSRYTSYTQLEESNPVLFFIIPQTAKLLMPKFYFKTLEVNSHRLVTPADIALTVLSLADMSISILPAIEDLSTEYTPHSLALKEVPVSHSCKYLGVQAPHLCICEGEWTPADNDTMYVGLAELAVASLNEIIRQQAGRSRTNGIHREAFYSTSPYETCLKLIGISFFDVRVRREGAQLVTQMSLMVAQKTLNRHAQGAMPLTDSFRVTLGSDFSRHEVGEMRMLGYVRMSNIGGRRGCSVGTGVDPHLCLCIPGAHRYIETPNSLLHHLQQTQFGVRPKLIHLHHPCLLLSIRQYGVSESVTFTAVNICESYTYKVTLRVVAVSVILSQTNPNTAVIYPLGEVTLNVAMKVSYHTPSSKVGYQVSYTLTEE